MSPIDCFIDFETRSMLDLKQVGAVKYAIDPSTEVTLVTYCFGQTGPLKYWRKGQPVPPDLIHLAENPEKYNFIAQNVAFDYMIFIFPLKRTIPTLVRPPIENIHDLMALACHFRMGASLESIAKMLGLPLSKDPIGRKLMLKQCKPDSKGKFYELTPDEWKHFLHYGLMDTEILRKAYYCLPALPEGERWAFEWTLRRNLRGLCIDAALVNELNAIVEGAMPGVEREFLTLTGGKLSLRSNKAKEFFKPYYPWIEDFDKTTRREILKKNDPVPWQIRRAVALKHLCGSSSIAKLKTAGHHKHQDRIYGILAYSFTQTKRWAGRGIQIQNFPRVDHNLADSLKFDMNVPDLASVVRSMRPNLKDPIGFVKNMLRRIFVPEAGKTFYGGDFAKVEPAVIFWLLGMGEIPPKWYEEMAAEIYNMTLEEVIALGKDSLERQIGKTANLSCQYGTGWESFQESTFIQTGISLSDDLAKQAVAAYRRKNPQVVKFWDDLETGFRKAVYGEATSLCGGKIFIYPLRHPWKGVQIRLPSGGHLFYHDAQEKWMSFEEEVVTLTNGIPVKHKVTKTRKVLCYKTDLGAGTVGMKTIYGGLICENVVSATGREILVPAARNLDNAGFDVLNLIHDEIWGQSRAGREAEFKQIMCINPSWCDMKIDAEIISGVRYLK